MDNIKIKLDGIATAKRFETDELFQRRKFEEIVNILRYHYNNKTEKKQDITECRTHNTIFIDGNRGVGKTAFMINIENYIKTEYKNDEFSKKFKFFKPIDPTLLENNEYFFSIVIARIVEEINSYIYNNLNFKFREEKREREYFEALDNISKAIGAIKTVSDEIGIDEIASYSSSIKLEQYAHEFFKTVTEIFGVDFLVFLIDDVDMAFNVGFDVLEVIRKYLTSPYIIPIVTGDYELYKKILEYKFKKNFNENNKNHEDDKIEELSFQYLQKVFPSEFRIELDELRKILNENNLIFEIDDKNITFKKLLKFEKYTLNWGIKREEEKYCPFTYNPRLFVKYFFRKKEIIKKFIDIIDNIDIVRKEELCKKVDINDLKTSFEATSEFYKYFDDEEKKLFANLLENDVNAFEINTSNEKKYKYKLYNAYNGNIFKNKDKFAEIKKYYKPKEENNGNKTDYLEDYIYSLFTYAEYINSYSTRLFIVGKKFIKLLVYSLDMYKNFNIEKNIFCSFNDEYKSKIKNISTINEVKWNEDLFKKMKEYEKIENECIKNIKNNDFSDKELERILFEKNIYFTNTKEDSFNQDESDEDINEDNINYKDIYFRLLFWNNNFIKQDYLTSVSLYKILIKFYKNIKALEELKLKDEDKKNYKKAIQRYVLILINAVAVYENDNYKVSMENFAVGEKFDLNNIFVKNNSSKLNIKPLVIGDKTSLTKALFFHPIIRKVLLFEENIENNNKKYSDSKKNINNDSLMRYLKQNNLDLYENLLKSRISAKTKTEVLQFLIKQISDESKDYEKIKEIKENSELLKKIKKGIKDNELINKFYTLLEEKNA